MSSAYVRRVLFRACCEIKGTILTPSDSMPHAHARAHAAAQHAPHQHEVFVDGSMDVRSFVAWRARARNCRMYRRECRARA
jgi:hypothetical protein